MRTSPAVAAVTAAILARPETTAMVYDPDVTRGRLALEALAVRLPLLRLAVHGRALVDDAGASVVTLASKPDQTRGIRRPVVWVVAGTAEERNVAQFVCGCIDPTRRVYVEGLPFVPE